jgi:N4-gp56 family major capsid protein
MDFNSFGSQFSSDAVSAYIAAKLLMIAQKTLVLYQICDKAQMKFGEGRTFQYSRYDRIPLPQAPLTEGVSPSGLAMSVGVVTGVLDQWGAWTGLTDVAIDSVKHPVLQQAISLLSNNARETIDREIFKVAASGTNIYYPNSVSARSGIGASDKLSSTLIGKVVANLRQDGAIPYADGLYMGVVDHFAEDDMMIDTTFVDAAKYGAIKQLYVNEIGTWKGVRWVTTNSMPILRLLSGASGASSATGGSLANSTTYNAKVAVVDKMTGHETYLSATFNAATGMSATSVDITIPALPAGATSGSKMRLYFGSNGGTLYLAANDIDPSSTYNQKTVPTSGSVAQAAPPATYAIHLTFVFGKEAMACIELNKMKATLTPNVASDSDPLAQRRKAGWKADFKAVICNEDFMARIEHTATNG